MGMLNEHEALTHLLSSEGPGGGVGDADDEITSDFPNALSFAAIAAAALTFSSSELVAGATGGGEGTAGGANGLYARGGGEAGTAGEGLWPIVDIAIRRR